MAIQSHSQVAAAQSQLDRAIRLFLDEMDFYSAGTLAGAAEEIFGKILEKCGKAHALSSLNTALSVLVVREPTDPPGDKMLITWLNEYRDWLKHYKGDMPIDFDAEDAAYDLIERAVENCFAATGNESEDMVRFKVFAMKREA